MGLKQMKRSACTKPKYLSLDPVMKKQVLSEIVENINPDVNHRQMAQECMIFTEVLEKRLKDPKATLKEIKRLFELRAEALKKALLITP